MTTQPPVFTYYAPIHVMPDLWSPDSQQRLLSIWRRSWAARGWNPIVLGEDDAKRHPQYEELRAKFWALPTPYGHDFEGPCFMRWAAMSAVGGGMLTDYDAINYNFEPREVDPHRMQVFADTSLPACMGAVLGSQKHFEEMTQRMANWVPAEPDWNTSVNGYHCSDLTLLIQYLDTGARPGPDWLIKVPGQSVFPDTTGDIVHYGYHMKAAGYWPKADHIEKIRPL